MNPENGEPAVQEEGKEPTPGDAENPVEPGELVEDAAATERAMILNQSIQHDQDQWADMKEKWMAKSATQENAFKRLKSMYLDEDSDEGLGVVFEQDQETGLSYERMVYMRDLTHPREV